MIPLIAAVILALSQTAGYVIVGLVPATLGVLATFYSTRANRTSSGVQSAFDAQATMVRSLMDDNRANRSELLDLQEKYIRMQGEQLDLRGQLLDCERERLELTARIATLEAGRD